MEIFINNLSENPVIKLLLIALLLDIFLGSIRAIKEHQWNSTVGINGMLRKFGMIGSIIFLALADVCIDLDLLFFVPEDVLQVVNLQRIGSCELFGIMFILYEITSILKNMILCGLPVPKGLKDKVENILDTMTTELEEKKNTKNSKK